MFLLNKTKRSVFLFFLKPQISCIFWKTGEIIKMVEKLGIQYQLRHLFQGIGIYLLRKSSKVEKVPKHHTASPHGEVKCNGGPRLVFKFWLSRQSLIKGIQCSLP